MDIKKYLKSKSIETKDYDVQKWAEIESRMGTELPSDYKEFINEYGTGNINNFMWILTPFDENEYVNLFKMGMKISEAYMTSKLYNPDFFKHDVFPVVGGILPWGYTENGDELYWLTEGESDDWKVIVYESRSSDFYEYSMGFVQFIYELISKKITCSAFPDDFPGEKSEFFNC